MHPTTMIRGFYRAMQNRALASRYLSLISDPSRPMVGTITEDEIPLLRELVTRASSLPGPIIEIGTLFGFSTQCIALAKTEDKPLITVDNYSWNPIGLTPAHHRELTLSALRYLTERSATTMFDGTNTEFYEQYAHERPAMVFIDASHDYEGVLVDLKWAKEQRVPIVSGHDYGPAAPGVTRAVHEVFGEPTHVMGRIWAWVDPSTTDDTAASGDRDITNV